MRLLTILTVLLAGFCSAAQSQTATYAKGSIYDLDPVASQSTSTRFLERINGSNDMQSVNEMAPDDILRKLGRPVGRLSLRLSSGKISYCTASLIGKDLILTNYHCIPGSTKIEEAMFWLGYVKPQSRKGVAQHHVIMQPLEANEALDYSILRVRGSPGREWGTLKFSLIIPKSRKSLFLIHHPGGFAQHISRGRCQTADPSFKGDDLLHVCDTIPGSSGAPIFDNSTRRVVGLHYSAVSLRGLNAGKRIASLVKASPTISKLVRGTTNVGSQIELAYWNSVKDSNDPVLYRTYLQQYPRGAFAPLARALIDRQTKAQKPQVDGTKKSKADRKVFGSLDQKESVANGPAPPVSTLSKGELIRSLQTELKRLGCYSGRIDGNWGRGSKAALKNFNLRTKEVVSLDSADRRTIDKLRNRTIRVCPPSSRSRKSLRKSRSAKNGTASDSYCRKVRATNYRACKGCDFGRGCTNPKWSGRKNKQQCLYWFRNNYGMRGFCGTRHY